MNVHGFRQRRDSRATSLGDGYGLAYASRPEGIGAALHESHDICHGFARQRPQAPANGRPWPKTRRLPAAVSSSFDIPPVQGGSGVEGHAISSAGGRRIKAVASGPKAPRAWQQAASRYQARPAALRPRDVKNDPAGSNPRIAERVEGPHPTNDTRGSGESGMKATGLKAFQ